MCKTLVGARVKAQRALLARSHNDRRTEVLDRQTASMLTRNAVQRRKVYQYRSKPRSLVFSHSVLQSVSRRHGAAREMLFQIAELALSSQATVGSGQPIYWNAADPRKAIAPDLFVHLGPSQDVVDCWKTWQRGAPEIVVEIVGDSDASEIAWQQCVAIYHEIGVEELVRFDPLAPADCLRIWDRVNDDLLERVVENQNVVESAVLGLYWVAVQYENHGSFLRLAKASDGTRLLPTPVEYETTKRLRAEQQLQRVESELQNRKKD